MILYNLIYFNKISYCEIIWDHINLFYLENIFMKKYYNWKVIKKKLQNSYKKVTQKKSYKKVLKSS